MTATATCVCGWTATYETRAKATRYKKLHRCDAYRPRTRRAPEPPHGTYARYVSQHFRCRCEDCRRAQRLYNAQRDLDRLAGKVRTVPAIGTVRRIQALMATGWTGMELAARLGVQRSNLPVHLRYERVHITLYENTRALYDELSLRAGPSTLTRTRALAAGFLPPEWWAEVDIDDPDALPIEPDGDECIVDEVAVERVLRGEAPGILSSAEQVEVTRRMLARGDSPTVIADRLHVGAGKAARLIERATAATSEDVAA